MRAEIAAWTRRYRKALRRRVGEESSVRLRPAISLGRQAVRLGIETLDVARIHAQSLATLALSGNAFAGMVQTRVTPLGRDASPRRPRTARRAVPTCDPKSELVEPCPFATRQAIIERTRSFFAEVIVPIEKTHRAALKADVRVSRLIQTLRRRSREVSVTTRRLKQGVARRQASEAALKKSGKQRNKLLAESHRLQTHLRRLTHNILSAQEVERQKASRQLQDEIAQTVLAIHVRLLTLREATKAGTEPLRKEIAETQRLVKQSARAIHRLVHEFGDHDEA